MAETGHEGAFAAVRGVPVQEYVAYLHAGACLVQADPQLSEAEADHLAPLPLLVFAGIVKHIPHVDLASLSHLDCNSGCGFRVGWSLNGCLLNLALRRALPLIVGAALRPHHTQNAVVQVGQGLQ